MHVFLVTLKQILCLNTIFRKGFIHEVYKWLKLLTNIPRDFPNDSCAYT